MTIRDYDIGHKRFANFLDARVDFLYSDMYAYKTQHCESFMPGTYAHLMITEKALEWFRGNQDINEKLRGPILTHSHFVHLVIWIQEEVCRPEI
jgi:hypothetical protein